MRPLYPHALPMRGPSFAKALVKNIATGRTIVFDPAARDVLRDRWPSYAVMHDASLYLVISAMGTVLYDPEVVVHYRQHADNAVGVGRGRVSRVAGRVRRQLSSGGAGAHGRQDRELAAVLGLTPAPSWGIAVERARVAACHATASRNPSGVHRQTAGSDIVRRLLQVAGRL